MTDQRTAQNILRHIDQGALVELAKSLIRIPSFIGEETPVARWTAAKLAEPLVHAAASTPAVLRTPGVRP